MRHKGFICWCLISALVLSLLIPAFDYYESDELQYITIQSARIELFHTYRHGWWVMIDDMYYCTIRIYPEEYENICDMAEAGEICIGVVRDLGVHFANFNNYDYRVISVYSPKIKSLITTESWNKNIRKCMYTVLSIIGVYFVLSFLYWYFLSDGKLINKWRKYRKKQKKLNYKKRHKKKQQKAKKT